MKTRVAIVGAGPAGFFAAQAIFAKDETTTVDFFEKLPTPWGLVRSGVAPDHPKIRTVSKVFEKILDDPRCRYFGNVEIGKDFSISQLQEKYDAVIFASGADIGRKLGIPGEELMGVHSAAEFVPWYNAHPDFADFKVDLSGTHAIVIGAGNVAMDVGRLLAVTPDELATTDIADHALEALRKSSIRKTMIVARRGPEHAAFTSPELRDLLDLEHTDVLVNAELVQQAIDRTQTWEEIPKDVRQNLEAFQNLSSIVPQGKDRELSINFLLAPIEILGDTKVSGVRFSINKIEGAEVIPTGETVDHPADIVISAVGYTSAALDGLPVINGKIRNIEGRITDSDNNHISGMYVVGWAKRGPSGVIGTNKNDAALVVERMFEDLATVPSRGTEFTPEIGFVDLAGWRKINESEIARGESSGRPRVKFPTYEELLSTARS